MKVKFYDKVDDKSLKIQPKLIQEAQNRGYL